ncbi:MAG: tetratricopeptide repeat protein [Deltaproteobacteria bacterium]|nr:tetratricopeptide repeat protein [Deltaproteobacteria bacterium]
MAITKLFRPILCLILLTGAYPAQAFEDDVTSITQAEVHYSRGRLAFNRGDVAEAQAEYFQTLKLLPSHVPAMMAVGQLYAMQGRDDQAQAYFQKVLAAQPTNTKAHQLLADIYFKKGDCEQAVSHYKYALEENAPLEENYYRLGLCYYNLQEYVPAYTYLKRCLLIDQGNIKARVLMEQAVKDGKITVEPPKDKAKKDDTGKATK